MAINTIKATIQMRRGAEEHFDPDQMTAGEWAVSTDSKKVWMCFAPGIVRRMATYEAFEEDMRIVQQILAACQDIQVAVEAFERLAEQHKDQAESYSKASQSWAVGGTGTRVGEDTNNSKYWSQQSAASASSAASSAATATEKASSAGTSAADAAASATGAAGSAATAAQEATAAGNSALAAGKSAQDAEDSAAGAEASREAAGASAGEAAASAGESSASAEAAESHERMAQSYAVGTGGEVRENDDSDSAKGYYEQARRLAQGFNGIMPMGTVTFAELSDPANQVPKYMFNISDAFVSDERFQDGGGIHYGAGNNVVFTGDRMWDVLAASAVTGVKGDAENEYRQGNINITAEDIGITTATAQEAGLVKPDGTTTTVDADGTLRAAIPEATIDYDELENRPAINGTVLEGDKALEELGGASVIRLTKAEYEALPEGKLTDGKLYLIEDGEPEGGPVMGVKGAAEEAYRSGYVEVSPADIGLGNVDDTPDMDKPVSTAQQEALDGKLDKAGGEVTGQLVVENGTYVGRYYGINGEGGYINFARIEGGPDASIGYCVVFRIGERLHGSFTDLAVYIDSGLKILSFTKSGYTDNAIYAEETESAINLYALKPNRYGAIEVLEEHFSPRNFRVVHPNSLVATVGSGWIEATLGGHVKEAEITSMIDDVPIMHRNTFRGKSLGCTFTAEQKAAVASGKFEDLFVGDYWEINGFTWRIVDINYWLNCGDTSCATPHLVIMPDESLYGVKMNETNTTVGGYVGSKMYKEDLNQAKEIINAAFGSANILNHREYLTNAVTDVYPSAGAWYDSTVELPNEIMMYGSHVHAPAGDGTVIPHRYTIDKTQLALMDLHPMFINAKRRWYWLRDVVSGAHFAGVGGHGLADYYSASHSQGVRPVFGLKG